MRQYTGLLFHTKKLTFMILEGFDRSRKSTMLLQWTKCVISMSISKRLTADGQTHWGHKGFFFLKSLKTEIDKLQWIHPSWFEIRIIIIHLNWFIWCIVSLKLPFPIQQYNKIIQHIQSVSIWWGLKMIYTFVIHGPTTGSII